MSGEARSVPKKNGLPKNVTEFQDRHGRWRLRFRIKGKPTYYFKSRAHTPEFYQELEACRSGSAMAPQIASRTAQRVKPGSMSALIAHYYNSPEFRGLKDSTKVTYRGILERFREDYGHLSVAGLQRTHVRAIIGEMEDRPAAANNLLRRLKMLMLIAMDDGWRTDDPTYRVKGFKIDSDGFHTWSDEEIARYRKRHPAGTKADLALTLLLYTGQRRSDVVKMGWQHIDGDRIRVRQTKTGTFISIPMHSELKAAIAGLPKENMTFLITEYGKPHSVKGFGAWVKKRATEAGLEDCSAHGLRKAAARRLAEAGCSNQEIKAITGHKTDKEVGRYTAAADQLRLSDRAMQALEGSDRERKNG